MSSESKGSVVPQFPIMAHSSSIAPPPLKYLVLDTGGIIDGQSSKLRTSATQHFTVREVLQEVRDKRSRHVLETLPFDLIVREPSEESIRAVRAFAKKSKDLHGLSITDLKVIALTYNLETQENQKRYIRDEPVAGKRFTGSIKFYDEVRGFGFITREKEIENLNVNTTTENTTTKVVEYFFHHSGLNEDLLAKDPTTLKGLKVNFSLVIGKKDRLQANAITVIEKNQDIGIKKESNSIAGNVSTGAHEVPPQIQTHSSSVQKPIQQKTSSSSSIPSTHSEEEIVKESQNSITQLDCSTVTKATQKTLSTEGGKIENSTTAPMSWAARLATSKAAPQPTLPSKEDHVIQKTVVATETTTNANAAAKILQESSKEDGVSSNASTFNPRVNGASRILSLSSSVMTSAEHIAKDAFDSDGGWIAPPSNDQQVTVPSEDIIWGTNKVFGDADADAKKEKRLPQSESELKTKGSTTTSLKEGDVQKKKQEGEDKEEEEEENRPRIGVACVTTDFAMQNVILQLGLKVLSLEGRSIRRIKNWVMKCDGCKEIFPDLTKMFCPTCGSDAVAKLSVTIDASGALKYGYNPNRKMNLRGTIFSIPKRSGGHGQRGDKGLLLREDQLLQGQWKKVAGKKSLKGSIFGDAITETVGGGGRMVLGEDVVVGYGRKNPNARRGRERRGQKKKKKRR
eukprot:g4279.t1